MQIGLLNHLNFPTGSKLPQTENTSEDATSAANDAATSAPGAAVRALTPAQDAPGVVLQLQSDAGPGVALANGLVYGDGRKTPGSDADSDIERMALQHSQALQRNAGSTTQLALDKDGVLVAKPASAAAKPQDFVSLAVSAMRNYADEQERLKVATKPDSSASAASLLPRSLAEVQKLASRFKLFA